MGTTKLNIGKIPISKGEDPGGYCLPTIEPGDHAWLNVPEQD